MGKKVIQCNVMFNNDGVSSINGVFEVSDAKRRRNKVGSVQFFLARVEQTAVCFFLFLFLSFFVYDYIASHTL